MKSIASARGSRASRLQASLRDERSGRVVFLSHCLLNENTRYLGGAFRAGAVHEVVDTFVQSGTGICQLLDQPQPPTQGTLECSLENYWARLVRYRHARPLYPISVGSAALRMTTPMLRQRIRSSQEFTADLYP